jgi:hypothetical protein
VPVAKPLAILRVKFADRATTTEAWSADTYDKCFRPLHAQGLARYWQDTTEGLLDLSGSHVFPWLTLGINQPTMWTARKVILDAAVEAATTAGIDLRPFAGLIVMAIPNLIPGTNQATLDTGAHSGSLRIGQLVLFELPAALLSEGDDHDFMAHEVGHVLGFNHSWTANPQWTPDSGLATEYGDPYCIMSGRQSEWVAPADPSFAVPATYRNGMGARPSASLLTHSVPEWEATGHVKRLASSVQNVSQTVRLYALDTKQKPSVVAVEYPNLFPTVYTAEYRRPLGWDAGVTQSVVIHTITRTGAPWATFTPIYRAAIPIPLGARSDWADPFENIALVVDAVADDQSWVDLRIGNASIAGRAASARIESWQWDREPGDRGSDVVIVPPGCAARQFDWYSEQRTHEITLAATSTGYTTPIVTWKVNGVVVPPVPGPLTLTVLAKHPGAVTTTSALQQVEVAVNSQGTRLTLVSRPSDGNYTLSVTATVHEGAGGPWTSTSPPVPVPIEGRRIQFDPEYYDAVEDCTKKHKDLIDRFSESRERRLGDGEGPTALIGALSEWQRAVAEADPDLALRVAQAANQLAIGRGLVDDQIAAVGARPLAGDA